MTERPHHGLVTQATADELMALPEGKEVVIEDGYMIMPTPHGPTYTFKIVEAQPGSVIMCSLNLDTPIASSIQSNCTDCAATIVHSPTLPEGCVKVCTNCGERRMLADRETTIH